MIAAAFIGYRRKIRYNIQISVQCLPEMICQGFELRFCGMLFFSYLSGYICDGVEGLLMSRR
jgi:hypothetical protein